MTEARRLLPPLALLALAICIPWIANRGNTTFLSAEPNIHQVSRLYAHTLRTEAARDEGGEMTQTVLQRLECYAANPAYIDRAQICNGKYLNGIVATAQKDVHATPAIGVFLEKVSLCPVVFSICRGEGGDRHECALRERQCIDAFLDRYWRGEYSSTRFLSFK